jgi:hypothetical protein
MRLDTFSRNKIAFPILSNGSLTSFFKEITFEVKEIIHKVTVATGRKLKDTNYTFFTFGNSRKGQNQGKPIRFSFFTTIFFFRVVYQLLIRALKPCKDF